MRAYVDSSVLLRVVLGESDRLRRWAEISRPVSSVLTRVECLRTIDRARVRLRLPDAEVAERREAVLEQLEGFDLVPLEAPVLDRAAEPFPTALGSLDALHLATALLLRSRVRDLTFATHDTGLAIAARAVGFRVVGV